MFLLQEMVKSVRKGTWETDCVEMKLTQDDTADPARFVGQGYLRQETGGAIRFRLYPSSVEGVSPMGALRPLGTPGVLIQPDRFYQLDARDAGGTWWQALRILPEVSTSHLSDGIWYIVNGDVREISFSKPFGVDLKCYCLTMAFFTDAEITYNTATKTTSSIAGRERIAAALNVACFSSRFGDFSISRHDGMVIVEIESDRPFPPHFETRIVEALGLVLAKPLHWNVIERIERETETVRMRGSSVILDAKLPPPVHLFAHVDQTGDVWRLFVKYLDFVCSHLGEGFHPCSRHLFSVLEASAGAISARGLALGVAVEGIVKEIFSHAGAPIDGMNEIAPLLREHFMSWSGIPKTELGESLRRRLPGMFSQLLNISTKDKLYALARGHVLYEAHVKAWSDLRNTSAHGVTPGSKSTQKLVDLCNQVTVLMYHLIFNAAGFEGTYQDYSTYGWPMRRYRGRAVTDEETAIAAYFIWRRLGRGDGYDLDDWFSAKDQLEKGLV